MNQISDVFDESLDKHVHTHTHTSAVLRSYCDIILSSLPFAVVFGCFVILYSRSVFLRASTPASLQRINKRQIVAEHCSPACETPRAHMGFLLLFYLVAVVNADLGEGFVLSPPGAWSSPQQAFYEWAHP